MMRKTKNTNRAVAITVLSLLIVVILIPATIAQPQQIVVKSTTGVKNETGVWLLGDGSETSDLVQLVNASSDPHSHICYIRIGEGVAEPFYDKGQFSHSLSLEAGTVIYCRAWNAPSYEEATYYGDSGTLTVQAGVTDYDFGTWSTDTTPAQPPVPDLPAIVLFASGLVLISVYFVYGRRKKRGE